MHTCSHPCSQYTLTQTRLICILQRVCKCTLTCLSLFSEKLHRQGWKLRSSYGRPPCSLVPSLLAMPLTLKDNPEYGRSQPPGRGQTIPERGHSPSPGHATCSMNFHGTNIHRKLSLFLFECLWVMTSLPGWLDFSFCQADQYLCNL